MHVLKCFFKILIEICLVEFGFVYFAAKNFFYGHFDIILVSCVTSSFSEHKVPFKSNLFKQGCLNLMIDTTSPL
jgi:hypothetical protein